LNMYTDDSIPAGGHTMNILFKYISILTGTTNTHPQKLSTPGGLLCIKTIFLASALTTLIACGGGSGGEGSGTTGETGPSTIVSSQSISQPECNGFRLWDFGDSDEIQNGTSFISESFGNDLSGSRFPCLAFWEFSPDANCSLAFSFEDYVSTFNIDEQLISEIVVSDTNLVVVGSNGSELTGTPASLTVQELSELSDCVLQ